MADDRNQPLDHWPDDELLRAAEGGNSQAYVVLCTRSLPTLLRSLRAMCSEYGVPLSFSHDFAQQAILNAIRSVRENQKNFRNPQTKFSRAFLRKIGHRLVIDWIRANRRESRAVKQFADRALARADADRQIEREREELAEFFDWLTFGEREIIELVLLQGLTAREAGERLGKSEDAAYKMYERAIAHLRDLRAEHGKLAIGHSMANGREL